MFALGVHDHSCGRARGRPAPTAPPPPHCPVAQRRACENAAGRQRLLEPPLIAPRPRRSTAMGSHHCLQTIEGPDSLRPLMPAHPAREHRTPVQTPICPDVAATLTVDLKLWRACA
jgi:hypothetical protein